MLEPLLPDAPSGALGDAPHRVLMAGDWHGNARWAIHILRTAYQQGVSHILHVGDFGFWHGREGADYLKALDRQLTLYGQVLWFVDGNHEDFDELLALPIDPVTGARPVLEGGRIFHLPRGVRWQWAGRTWMGLGGATSVDRPLRTPGRSWWPQEAITDYQAELAAAPGPVDVMLTHDCPDRVHIPGLMKGLPQREQRLARDHRRLLGRVVDAVHPELLVHGHFHVRYDKARTYLDGPDGREACRIVGLDCDGGTVQGNAIVLDTATLEFAPAEGAGVLRRVRQAMDAAGVALRDIEPDYPGAAWRASLSSAMAGHRPFTSLHLALIAESCGVTVDDLLGDEG